MTKRIAILFHEHERRRSLPRFAIWHLAKVWQEEGIQVIFLFGVHKYLAADLVLLHVDLTRVPDKYFEFAGRYPAILNGRIQDIRKSIFSRHQVKPEDGYEGPVIVKSELNYAGEPERKLLGSLVSRLSMRIKTRFPFLQSKSQSLQPVFRSPADYKIFDNKHSVPKNWYERDDILVEKFLPELQDGFYCLRNYHCLGDRGICVLRRSKNPIINSSTAMDRREVEPAAEIVEAARSMRLDYGKLDYVLSGGKPILLDINKTPGAGKSDAYFAMCREWAQGIKRYL
jgi:hypothetical protein